MKRSRLTVTDHALVRYLERVLLVDVEGLRQRLARDADSALERVDGSPLPGGERSVLASGLRYRIHGHSITTVMPMNDGSARKRRRRHRGRGRA